MHISTAGLQLPPVLGLQGSGYVVSKTAAAKLHEFVAAARPDVQVISVHPGLVDTDMGRAGRELAPPALRDLLQLDDGEHEPC